MPDVSLQLGFEDFALNATAVVAVLAERLKDVRLLRLLQDPIGCLVYPLCVK